VRIRSYLLGDSLESIERIARTRATGRLMPAERTKSVGG
jgi:hypothetical protein